MHLDQLVDPDVAADVLGRLPIGTRLEVRFDDGPALPCTVGRDYGRRVILVDGADATLTAAGADLDRARVSHVHVPAVDTTLLIVGC